MLIIDINFDPNEDQDPFYDRFLCELSYDDADQAFIEKLMKEDNRVGVARWMREHGTVGDIYNEAEWATYQIEVYENYASFCAEVDPGGEPPLPGVIETPI